MADFIFLAISTHEDFGLDALWCHCMWQHAGTARFLHHFRRIEFHAGSSVVGSFVGDHLSLATGSPPAGMLAEGQAEVSFVKCGW